MSLGERCDEIMRLIDEVLGDQPATEVASDEHTVAVLPSSERIRPTFASGISAISR